VIVRGRRQLHAHEPGARLRAEQPAARRDAVVVEHGLDALLPLAALIDERVAQSDTGAQVEQVLGRDPRFRQPTDHQQLAQMARVGAVALGPLLGPAARRGLGRLGQMNLGADRPELLNDEPPARRRLQSHLDLLAAKRAAKRRTPSRSAGATRLRAISPVSVSSHSAVICARCWSSPTTIVTRGLLKLHDLKRPRGRAPRLS
jgi:hypothetical protein